MSTRDRDHGRPHQASDGEVQAAGKVSEAQEWIERARGALYTFHQLIGHADLLLDDAVELLRKCDQNDLAELVRTEVIGRNVIDGRWTFQVVEEFDDGYYSTAVAANERVLDELMQGRRHVFEAELKEARRTHGRAGHEAQPPRRAPATDDSASVRR
ncbi:MAG: hypothetical protein ABIP21_12510 [Acidimicrobiia bacterium]